MDPASDESNPMALQAADNSSETTDDPPTWDGETEINVYLTPEMQDNPRIQKLLKGIPRLKESINQEKQKFSILFRELLDRDPEESDFSPRNTGSMIDQVLADDSLLDELLKNDKTQEKFLAKLHEFPRGKEHLDKITNDWTGKLDATRAELTKALEAIKSEAESHSKIIDDYDDHAHTEFDNWASAKFAKERPDLFEYTPEKGFIAKKPEADTWLEAAMSAYIDSNIDKFNPRKALRFNDAAHEPGFAIILAELGKKFAPPTKREDPKYIVQDKSATRLGGSPQHRNANSAVYNSLI